MSQRVITAVVVAGVGAAVLVALRWLARRALARYLALAARRRPADEIAGMRTRLSILTRVALAAIAVVLAFVVLELFPATRTLSRTLLASGAVLAVLTGLAFTTPLANLGGGLLLAFTQPVRLGDRITIGEVTGVVEEINLIHTVLLTDDDRRVFIPNSQMVSTVVVNRTIEDPRRSIVVRLPVSLGTPLDEARGAVLDAVHADTDTSVLEGVSVLVTEIEARNAWLALTAYAQPGARIGVIASELREAALGALQRGGHLPA